MVQRVESVGIRYCTVGASGYRSFAVQIHPRPTVQTKVLGHTVAGFVLMIDQYGGVEMDRSVGLGNSYLELSCLALIGQDTQVVDTRQSDRSQHKQSRELGISSRQAFADYPYPVVSIHTGEAK